MSSPRICVIGAGHWATRMHRPAIQRLAQVGRVRVVGVCDLDAARAGEFAAAVGANTTTYFGPDACGTAALGCECGTAAPGCDSPAGGGPIHTRGGCATSAEPAASFTDAAAMLDQCRPDGVAILVNPAVTPAMIELAAQHRVPFLTEKPPATDAATHRRLIEAVGPLPHLVAYNRRFAPYSAQAGRWLAGRAIQSITCLFSRYRRRDADFTTTAVHAIDAVRFLAGGDYAELRIAVDWPGEVPADYTDYADLKLLESVKSAESAGNLPAESTGRPVRNFFLSGWMASGARVDILITPDTASGEEHYIVRAAGRTVRLAFPHTSVIDAPGYVELHEGNKVIARLGPRNFQCDPADQPALLGIVAEHEAFYAALADGVVEAGPASQCSAIGGRSTLAATLQTQQVREELARVAGLGELGSPGSTGCRQERDVKF